MTEFPASSGGSSKFDSEKFWQRMPEGVLIVVLLGAFHASENPYFQRASLQYHADVCIGALSIHQSQLFKIEKTAEYSHTF